jgi:hypothetical protein
MGLLVELVRLRQFEWQRRRGRRVFNSGGHDRHRWK